MGPQWRQILMEEVVDRASHSQWAEDVASPANTIEGMAHLAMWAKRVGKSAVCCRVRACVVGAKQRSALRPPPLGALPDTFVFRDGAAHIHLMTWRPHAFRMQGSISTATGGDAGSTVLPQIVQLHKQRLAKTDFWKHLRRSR